MANTPRTIGYKHPESINDSREDERQALRRARVCSREVGTFSEELFVVPPTPRYNIDVPQVPCCGEALAVAANEKVKTGPKRWVIDTGSGNDLVGKADLTPMDIRDVEKFSPSLVLATANGHIVVDDCVDLQVSKLLLVIKAKILPDTPAVLSVGKRCMEEDYSFIWHKGKLPILIHPDGKVTVLKLDNLVPYIEEWGNGGTALPGLVVNEGAVAQEGIPNAKAVAKGGIEDAAAVAEAEIPEAVALTGEEKLKAVAKSPEHALTHLPKNPYCQACQNAKAYKKQARRRDPATKQKASAFGDLVMADHMVVMKDSEERVSGEKAALMIYDEGTDWRELVGVPSKSAAHAELALQTFVGSEKVKAFYSDNSKELKAAARKLAWVHATATPYRPESNG